MARAAASRARTTTGQPFLTPRRREALIGYLFASPWIIGFVCLTLGPMIFSLYVSFTQYHVIDTPRWIGLDNYSFIFRQDDDFRTSLGNTFYYVLIKTPLVISFSLLVAVLLNMPLPGRNLLRLIYYMPTVTTGVAATFLWVWLLNPTGIVNKGLGLFGIQGPNWFYSPTWSKPALIFMGMWYIGSPVLILLAGLNGVPKALHEAAEVDGAGVWTRFWRITIPMLSPTLLFLVITNLIGAFQVFNSAFVASNVVKNGSAAPGDPEKSLLFYEIYLYHRAFGNFSLDMGFASALAWILFIIVLVITGAQLWLSKRWVYYES